MTFLDDLKKSLTDFAESNSAVREFYKDWQRVRRDQILPFFDQMTEVFNAQTDTTGFSAAPKLENGSIRLEISKKNNKGGAPAGLICFQATEDRKIIFTVKMGDVPLHPPESFDLGTLDFRMVEAQITAFIKVLLYGPIDPMGAPSPPQRRVSKSPVTS